MATASAIAPVESLRRSILSFFTGSVAATWLSLVATLLITRWTPPEQLGLWNLALLISTYASVLQVGAFNGLNRQLPFLQGSGDTAGVERAASAALAWCRLLAGASIAATLGVASVLWFLGRMDHLWTTLAIGTVVTCSWPLQYLTVTYSAHTQFGALARKNTWSALLGLPLVTVAYFAGFAGLLLRAASVAILNVCLLWNRRPTTTAPKWQFGQLKSLIRIGFPIWVVGQLGALFMTLDRVVLADSAKDLGFYSIAAQFAALAVMVPTAFNAVYYSHMARAYGSHCSAMSLWWMAVKAALRSAACGLGLGALCWFTIPAFVSHVLPAYAPGIQAAQWTAFTGLVMAPSIFGNIFNILGRQDVYLVGSAVGLLTFLLAWQGLSALPHQTRLSAAAQSMLAATLVASLCSVALSLWLCRVHDRRRSAASAPSEV